MGNVDPRRHARQLLLAEIGAAGQQRLCATRVQLPVAADPRAAAIAHDYLERAGLQVIAAGAAAANAALEVDVAGPPAVRALAGRPELDEAAAALAGAFAAVEAIKQALDLPRAALHAQLTLAEERP